MILKCKICGGDIELNDEKGIGTCLYCGSTMTFPKATDEQKVSMFNRGNHFRRLGEFDKASAVYEQIIHDDDKDAEAHWCAALCRFGIEYVEDPDSLEYIPTCHRASFDSFLDDIDFLAAVHNSEGIVQKQYQKDGKKIEEVRQGILVTSSGEDPFDVFICYKESDIDGGRTQDSVLAQDIYDQLSEKGYKVFFARITLEDKVGTQYEPYIFAALNSAKVMIVVGTSKENLDAVWVKNEWSRFLSMMRKERSKVIIPCYKDMDPYDMPEALSVLQSYNMAMIGFHQDLLRGVSKILGTNTAKSIEGTKSIGDEVKPLLERVFLFLEDGRFKEADEYAEKVLDKDPKNAEAYIGKLMSSLHMNHRGEIGKYAGDLETFDSYKKALKYSPDDLRAELEQYKESAIRAKTEKEKRTRQKAFKGCIALTAIVVVVLSAIVGIKLYIANVKIPKEKYEKAISLQMNHKYSEAIDLYSELGDYKDSNAKIAECNELIMAEENDKKIKQQEQEIQQIFDAEEGSTISFGSFGLEADSSKKEAIEWIVLLNKEGKLLLLSKYGLLKKPFDNRAEMGPIWCSSTLRKWLNEDFYNDAFNEIEKKYITMTHVIADPKYQNNSGQRDEDTDDKVFLLSEKDIEGHMSGIEGVGYKKCCPLEYADKQDDSMCCNWWLRTPEVVYGDVKIVNGMGTVNGRSVDRDDIYVRPAIWISKDE